MGWFSKPPVGDSWEGQVEEGHVPHLVWVNKQHSCGVMGWVQRDWGWRIQPGDVLETSSFCPWCDRYSVASVKPDGLEGPYEKSVHVTGVGLDTVFLVNAWIPEDRQVENFNWGVSLGMADGCNRPLTSGGVLLPLVDNRLVALNLGNVTCWEITRQFS